MNKYIYIKAYSQNINNFYFTRRGPVAPECAALPDHHCPHQGACGPRGPGGQAGGQGGFPYLNLGARSGPGQGLATWPSVSSIRQTATGW